MTLLGVILGLGKSLPKVSPRCFSQLMYFYHPEHQWNHLAKFGPCTLWGKLKSLVGNFGVNWFRVSSHMTWSAIIFYSLNNHYVPHDQIISMYLQVSWSPNRVAQNLTRSQRKPRWQRKNLFSLCRVFKFWVEAFVPNGMRISPRAPRLLHF